jgi:TorA maturation chaperone TorD
MVSGAQPGAQPGAAPSAPPPPLSDATLLAASLQFGVLGKSLYREQTSEELDRMLEARMFAEAPFADDQEDTLRGLSLLSLWAEACADGVGEGVLDEGPLGDIRHDHFYLFAGVGRPLASPWESTYFNEARLTFEKQTLEVRDWYRRYGLMIGLKNKEPDDHIGYELGFIAHLAQLALDASKAGDPAACEATLHALGGFLTEHPLRWAFVWSERVQIHARSDFYRGLALLVSGSLRGLSERLGIDMRSIRQCALSQHSAV